MPRGVYDRKQVKRRRRKANRNPGPGDHDEKVPTQESMAETVVRNATADAKKIGPKKVVRFLNDRIAVLDAQISRLKEERDAYEVAAQHLIQ